MEKQKGKAGYYVLSVVPLFATLIIQVLSGLTCSVIGTVVYSVRIAMNGEAELLNDPAALQAGALQLWHSRFPDWPARQRMQQ